MKCPDVYFDRMLENRTSLSIIFVSTPNQLISKRPGLQGPQVGTHFHCVFRIQFHSTSISPISHISVTYQSCFSIYFFDIRLLLALYSSSCFLDGCIFYRAVSSCSIQCHRFKSNIKAMKLIPSVV